MRVNLEKYFDIAFHGKPVTIFRKEDKNVVVISEKEYNELKKAKHNVDYLTHIDRSYEQLKNEETVSKSMEELEMMASE